MICLPLSGWKSALAGLLLPKTWWWYVWVEISTSWLLLLVTWWWYFGEGWTAWAGLLQLVIWWYIGEGILPSWVAATSDMVIYKGGNLPDLQQMQVLLTQDNQPELQQMQVLLTQDIKEVLLAWMHTGLDQSSSSLSFRLLSVWKEVEHYLLEAQKIPAISLHHVRRKSVCKHQKGTYLIEINKPENTAAHLMW